MLPDYNLDKIKYATDAPTFEKAVDLYEKGKVTQFEEDVRGYSAVVLGTHPYSVAIDARRFGEGNCDCYLGQQDTLCKHIVALSIYAVKGGKKLSGEDKKRADSPVCSGRLGELSKDEVVDLKNAVTSALKYIKSYNGPSRLWFSYQHSLDEGCARLVELVSSLPVSAQTSALLVDLLLRLDKKLMGGVDDSNGTVGGFIEEVVLMLQEYAKLDKKCIKTFEKLCDKETCFDWEESLVQIVDEGLS